MFGRRPSSDLDEESGSVGPDGGPAERDVRNLAYNEVDDDAVPIPAQARDPLTVGRPGVSAGLESKHPRMTRLLVPSALASHQHGPQCLTGPD